jgi:hypothetical protein
MYAMLVKPRSKPLMDASTAPCNIRFEDRGPKASVKDVAIKSVAVNVVILRELDALTVDDDSYKLNQMLQLDIYTVETKRLS